MTQPYRDLPWYNQAWQKVQQFPAGLARGAKNPPMVSGPAAAAFVSAAIGCFAMMVAHHLSDADHSKAIESFLWSLGSWIPGSRNPSKLWGNIGSYTGKETVLLLAWLISWPILHLLWKDRAIAAITMIFWLLSLLIAATAMAWHPLFPYLPLV
jgi:hypothetical protein